MRARHPRHTADSPNGRSQRRGGRRGQVRGAASLDSRLLALVGDAADGFPGLPGWGAKSAAAVLARFGHLEAIPDDWGTWKVDANRPAALAETLARRRDDALLFRDLATLRTGLPLFESVDALEWKGPRPSFKAIAERLNAAAAAVRP